MREQTLDELEGVVWGSPLVDSHLVRTCHRLRTKPIDEFGAEDLRIMLGQNIGLPYLLPLAVERLEQHPWASGDMYPGDLLVTTARADVDWAGRPDLADRFRAVAERALAALPALRERDVDGLPDLDAPDEELRAEIARELRAALERLPSRPRPAG